MVGRTPSDRLTGRQRLVVGFRGTTVTDRLRAFIREGAPAGVILFGRNIADTAQTAQLIRDVRALWPPDGPVPIVSVDQEGGPVRRLKAPECPEFLAAPAMREACERLDLDGLQALGRAMGAQLAAVGFNVDYAPVLDVDTNPANPIIGARAFGRTPDEVSARALAFARGLEGAGVLPCGKHFPGHGDTDQDSHLTLPRLSHDRARLDAIELAPFKAAADAGVPLMMTAHIVYEALDPEHPATLSERVLPTLLRDALGYDGVVVSDDLEMRAVAAHYDADAIARLALPASVDLFLVCSNLDLAADVADALERHETVATARATHRRLTALQTRLRDHAPTASATIPQAISLASRLS